MINVDFGPDSSAENVFLAFLSLPSSQSLSRSEKKIDWWEYRQRKREREREIEREGDREREWVRETERGWERESIISYSILHYIILYYIIV